uniref:NR LBD domain-containing protein n=2 Tax=Caenorhabditis tropicalis TaxID=1561998 RepID=A0A1I7T1M5_9PELO
MVEMLEVVKYVEKRVMEGISERSRAEHVQRFSDFQYDRDVHHAEKSTAVAVYQNIPPSMSTFLGRPNLIIYSAPPSDFSKSKALMDVQFLIDKAQDILKTGLETPLYMPNSLEKLAMGLDRIRGRSDQSTKIITKVGKEEIFAFLEDDMSKVAKWLTYFDEFQLLSDTMQIDILKGLWSVFGRLERLATTAIARQQNLCGENELMTYIGKDVVMCDRKNLEIDLSWCSKYTFEQLKLFDSHDSDKQLDMLIQMVLDLKPTDVELAYMLCQLCFHQVGKKYQGAIQEVTDRFQEVLSNHLHDYYVNTMRQSKYANRIASMMKINNTIQQCIYRDKVKSELFRVFDVFHVKCSHPELFSHN